MKKSFTSFYQEIGFIDYPFRDKTAEREDTSKLFVRPLNYSTLEDLFYRKSTTIINGDRGTGKTIMLDDLKTKVNDNRFISLIINYESIRLENNILDFYSLILKNVAKNILIYLADNKTILKNLSKEDKILLSFLIFKYSDDMTDLQLTSKIENIQLNRTKKIINYLSKPITFFLNYFGTAITNYNNDKLTHIFGNYLPNIDSNSVRNIFPDIKFGIDDNFKTVEISYNLFNKSMELFTRILNQPPIVFLDKLDEDTRLENDADQIATFIKDLLCDSNLLLNSNIQLLISVWKIPFFNLETIFRRSKHFVYDITWDRDQLITVLNQRLFVYSNKKINNYETLFSADVDYDLVSDIFILSNSNPRDLWGLLDKIFNAQYDLDDDSKIICKRAVEIGIQKFVKTFSFYEYYPKKKNAQKNSNDVYSYINHLLKLDHTDEFTNNELRNQANTGGSTSNYITGMLGIGLVTKTDKKRDGGAVIYKINDPKVSYAIFHDLEITR